VKKLYDPRKIQSWRDGAFEESGIAFSKKMRRCHGWLDFFKMVWMNTSRGDYIFPQPIKTTI